MQPAESHYMMQIKSHLFLRQSYLDHEKNHIKGGETMFQKAGLTIIIIALLAVVFGIAAQDPLSGRAEEYRKVLKSIEGLSAPPGVSLNAWVPLSANAGIVIKPTSQQRRGKTEYFATLMVKTASDNSWHVVILDNQPGLRLLGTTKP
jgi:hypothetical protein